MVPIIQQTGSVARASAGITADDNSAGLTGRALDLPKRVLPSANLTAGTNPLAQRNTLAITEKRGWAAVPSGERPCCHST